MRLGPADADGVFVGYGDINANPGPIDLLKIDRDGVATVLLAALPTEVVDRWRVLNDGVVWVPSIDPRGSAAGFLATNEGGTWRTETVSIDGLPVVEHMFDVAQEPNGDLYVLISHVPDTAAIWKSTDFAASWEESLAYASGEDDGYTRFYNFHRSGGVLATARNDGTRYVLNDGSWETAAVEFDPVPEVYPMSTLPGAGSGWTASAGPGGEVYLCNGSSIYLTPPPD